jgi:hypothetical protein
LSGRYQDEDLGDYVDRVTDDDIQRELDDAWFAQEQLLRQQHEQETKQ